MKFTVNRTALVTLLIASVLAISACNTVEGIGRDTERAGEKIQNSSK